MKTNKEILDQFGKLLVTEVFDSQFRFIKNDLKDLSVTEGYTQLFANMNETAKKELENYTSEILRGALFDFLRLFEENSEFKILYADNNQTENLSELSEMLKAEPIINNGWIERYSIFKTR